jgi:hypothetical protein
VKPFGFEASALSRAVLGGAFIAVAAILVRLIERSDPTTANVIAESSAVTRSSWPVTIESTYPVAEWSVSILGVEQAATHHDDFSWSGAISAASGDELLIQARPAAAEHVPHHGLRLLVGAAGERLVWGEGEVTATVELSR